MAFPDGDDLDRRARRRRDRRMPSPEDENDWSAGSEYRRHQLPYRKRPVEREMVESAGSRPSPQRRSREPSFQPEPATMTPVTRRPSAVPRRARDPLVYEQTSGTDSRRSSRKDYSPRYHISTPGSKRSSHTTVSDSDEESTWTPSTQEDDRGRRSLERYRPSPRKELLRRRARHSGGRRSKLAVPLVPELVEVEDEEESSEEEEEEEDDNDDEDADEDESEEEDTEEDEVETEPRLKARLSGRRMPEEDITSRSPPRPRFTYRTRERHRGPPLSEDHYRPSPPRRPPRRTHGSDIVLVKPTTIRRSNTIGGSYTPSSLTTSTRRSSIFDSFRPRSARTSYEREEKVGTCAACYEETPSRKTVKLSCGHRMCNSCLKQLFKLSVTDPQHMPPRCCGREHIPLKHVERLLDRNFKNTFERKFAEYSARNQLYCPSKRCGEPILPDDVYEDRGRKCAQCSRCGAKICGACNGRWHSSRECPVDEVTNQILEQARDESAQRCYRCRNLVESMDGCNRMTCRCGAQFCKSCGRKWGRCNCPLFNEETMDPDDLDERIPVPTLTRSETFPRSPPLRHYRGKGHPKTRPLAPRVPDFEEEIPVRPHRDRRDPDLARRFERLAPRESTPREIHSRGRDRPRGKGREQIDEPIREPSRDDDDYDFYDDDYDGYDFDEDGEYRGSVEDDLDRTPPRRRRGHDGFRRRDDTVVPPSPPAAPQGYDRAAKTADYISDVSKARGVRGSSMERRLADRFSPQRATPTRNAPAHTHPHHPQHELAPMSPMVSMAPPMVPPAPNPIARRHTAEEDLYNMVRARPSERAVLGRGRHDYVEQIPGRRHSDEMLTAQSAMAGLNGAGRGMNRVIEWMEHVEPGPPEEEAPAHRRRLHY